MNDSFALRQELKRPFRLVIAIGLAGCLLWSYWPTLLKLVHQWSTNPQYSHGYLVPAFALVMLWLRRGRLVEVKASLHWWGLGWLLLAGLLRLTAAYLYNDWLEAISLLVCLVGFAVLIAGRPGWQWSWPAIAFLVFMIPLPFRLETALAHPLQRMATIASTYALQTIGFPALSEGNVILLNEVRMEIVRACSGLSMLMVFFALSTAVAYLTKRPMWEKLVIVASAIPIALVTNIVRITVTGVMHETVGSYLANLVFHELAGLLMVPFALCLLWIELKILSRLLVTPTAAKPIPLPSMGLPAPLANGSEGVDEQEAKTAKKGRAVVSAK